MNIRPELKMSVDEFLPWAAGQRARYELLNGELVQMSPETLGHNETKAEIFLALRQEVRRRNLPCSVHPDGMTVRIDQYTAFEPDVLLRCGPRLDRRAVELPDPLMVVEVLSVATRQVDLATKLAGYFRVPSIVHYLIVDPDERLVIHHRRGTGEVIETRILEEGTLRLDPPGLSLPLADLFPPGAGDQTGGTG